MPINPKSIHVKPSDKDILNALLVDGATIRGVAMDLKTHTKRVNGIRIENAHLFPKKEKVFRTPKLPKKKGVKRWVTVPVEIDEKICMAARDESKSWQEQANLIFREWGER